MTTPNLEQIIADHHAEYDVDTYHLTCRCGTKWPALREDFDAELLAHAAHVVAAIRDSGYTVIALPEPTDTYDHCREEPMTGWEIGCGPYFVQALTKTADVQISYNGEPEEPLPPDAAIDFGAALIAAAKHAGDTQ